MRPSKLDPWPIGTPPSPQHCGEETRASVLATYGLDALEDDDELARITRFAADLCGTPVAMVTLVEAERQRFLTRVGVEERETPRPTSFCAHAMLEPEPMVVADATLDNRFSTNPLVTGHPFVRFYAGAPLVSHEGAPLGSLCVIDTQPRAEGLTDLQRDGLQVLAESVMRRLRHRRETMIAEVANVVHRERIQNLIDEMPQIAWSADADGNFDYYNRQFAQFTGSVPPPDAEGWRQVIHEDDHEATFSDWYERFASGEPFDGEFRLKHKVDGWRWMISNARPVGEGESLRWFGTLTDIDEDHREGEVRDILSRELSHRIKNIFAVVSSLISMRARKRPEVKEFADDLTATIRALGRAHDFVRPIEGAKGDNIVGLLHELMAPYIVLGEDRVVIEGADGPIGPRVATPLALVFHELATNAAKYGALSNDEGTVHIAIEAPDDSDEVRVVWSERGAPVCEKPENTGFGSRLVQLSVEGQLGGSIEREWVEGGVDIVLSMPRSTLTA